jgi:hypothetical protein
MMSDFALEIIDEDPLLLEFALGSDGAPGLSAYEVWLDAGHEGTEADFLDWLKGAPGDAGPPGSDGAPGPSAYEVWLDAGHEGTEADFLDWLKGAPGVGVPTGGTAGQVLAKASGADLDTTWVDPPEGGGGGGAVGDTITLPADPVTLAPPTAGNVTLFGTDVGGRVMPAFMGADGMARRLQPALGGSHVVWIQASHGSSGGQINFGSQWRYFGGGVSYVSTGNTFNSHKGASMPFVTFPMGAVSGLQGYKALSRRLHNGFFVHYRFGGFESYTKSHLMHAFWGVSGRTRDTDPADANPSTTITDAIGIGKDLADANWQVMTRIGSGAAVKVDTGIPVADRCVYNVYIYAMGGVVGWKLTREADPYRSLAYAEASGVISTGMPADTVTLYPIGYYAKGGSGDDPDTQLYSLFIESGW